MTNKLSSSTVNFGRIEGNGPLGTFNLTNSEVSQTTNDVFSMVIGVLTMIAVLFFMVKLFIGAYNIISSGGDKAKVSSGRGNILNGLIGIIIVVAAIFILDLIGFLLGIEQIRNPGDWIYELTSTYW